MPNQTSDFIPNLFHYQNPAFQNLKQWVIGDQTERPRWHRSRSSNQQHVNIVQRNICVCNAIINFLVQTTGVKKDNLLGPTRGKRHVARIRQLGMYIAHTIFQLSMSAVAAGFGRDRTTVLYAIHLFEDMRENRQIDVTITSFEEAVRQPMQTGEMADV